MVLREGETVEFKERYTEDIRKEIIAFANTDGGVIYIGIDDDGSVVGIDDMDFINQQLTNGCRDAVKPDITMFIRYDCLTMDGKNVLAVNVQRGTSKPYYLSAKGLRPSGVFVRQGTSTAPASDEAIRRMIKESDGDSYENMRSLHQELTFETAEKEFELRNLPFGEVQKKNLGLMTADGVYTNLGLLLSDQCPHIIKSASFLGSTQEVFQDRREFSGSLLKQMNEAYEYMELRNRRMATFAGLRRTDSRDYPETALREALLNTIVHRDYSFSAPTLIRLYDDRVEFVSYGGLAGNVSLKDVLMGLSVCRNPGLANVYYRLELIEAYGTGLIKMRDSYKGKACAPEFLVGSNSFKVILPNINECKDEIVGTDATRENVIAYIRQNPGTTRANIEKQFGLSNGKTIRLLKELVDGGIVKRIGKGKNIAYTVQ